MVIYLSENMTMFKIKYDEYKTSAKAAVFEDVYKYLIYKCHISNKKAFELCYFCKILSFFDKSLLKGSSL